jgi:hypothetical protein
MRSKIIIGLMFLLIFFLGFSSRPSLAQDPGDPDTVGLANVSGEIGDVVSMSVFLYNDAELVSAVIPLLLDGYSGWLRFDSVSYVGSRLENTAVLDEREVYVFETDTFTYANLLLSFSVSSGNNLPIGTGKLCDLWFTLHFGGEVLVDSLSDSPQGGLLLTDTNKGSFAPQFLSGLIDISCDYLIGDVNGDGGVHASDIVQFQKLWYYDWPVSAWVIGDRCGAADLNCDRRLDMRDLVYLVNMVNHGFPPYCTCGTVNPPLYDDPGLPDTVWVDAETLIVGIPSTIFFGVISDEPLTGMALGLEWDGSAVLEWDHYGCSWTDRMDPEFWMVNYNYFRANGVNPDTILYYAFKSGVIPLPAGRDAVGCARVIPQSVGTANFRLVSYVNAGPSMLVTENHAAILPVFYGGNITVLEYLPGDPNHDGIINSADIVYLINYLFKGGPQPDPIESGDTNGDEVINSSDVVYLINYLFKGGPEPRG